jgi:hypothetical protein
MNEKHPNWKDRSKDPDGFSESEECSRMVARMTALLHKIQTGILFTREWEEMQGIPDDRRSTGPKHLRVGVDQALIEHGALCALLIEKGIIKAKDYYETQIEFLERDVEAYTERLKERFGANFTLH